MKKTLIKIGLPFIVLAVIFAVIISTQKPIEELSSDLRINSFNFNNYVETYISDSIKGKPLIVAQSGYDHLYDIIKTESSIEVTDSIGNHPLITSQEAEELFTKSFKAYFFIFGSEVNRFFSNSEWKDSELNKIKTESQRLLTMQGTAFAKDSLNNYTKYVNGYYSAKRLMRIAKNCSSKSSYEDYCKRARSYKCYPYNNNASFANIVSSVSNDAISGWQQAINDAVNNLINKPNYDFGTYSNFYTELQSVFSKIADYNKTVNSSWGSDLRTKLNNKDNVVKQFYQNN